MLKSGGVFARFANHPYKDKGNVALSDAIDDLYSEYYCAYHGKDTKSAKEYGEEQALQRAQIAKNVVFPCRKKQMLQWNMMILDCPWQIE